MSADEATHAGGFAFETIPNAVEARAISRLIASDPQLVERKCWLSLQCRDACTLADGTPLAPLGQELCAALSRRTAFTGLGTNCVPPDIAERIISTLVAAVVAQRTAPAAAAAAAVDKPAAAAATAATTTVAAAAAAKDKNQIAAAAADIPAAAAAAAAAAAVAAGKGSDSVASFPLKAAASEWPPLKAASSDWPPLKAAFTATASEWLASRSSAAMSGSFKTAR
mmetsp:Transcript_42398/g.99523  ORF Transcript_42398/g.99523 Transcript_42398/m.99523 type:complete len:225 (-) Transcript_42398:240-914(-)